MGKYASMDKSRFVLAIGDNMYNFGVRNANDPQFMEKFEETFEEDSLQIPWYLCGGNHDYYGNISAQIDYSKLSSRWNYPSYYYAVTKTYRQAKVGERIEWVENLRSFKSSDLKVLIVSIDTWRINGGDTFVSFDPSSGKSALVADERDRSIPLVTVARRLGKVEKTTEDLILDNYKTLGGSEGSIRRKVDYAQLRWLNQTLHASDADYKIVMGHFPVFSASKGEHGDTPRLVEHLHPILKYNKVDAYINGHDHILQHISKGGIQFFGSGAGARKHSKIQRDYNGLQGYNLDQYGFMVHQINKTAMTTTFIVNEDGKPKEVYKFTARK
mmetsp:Transcript_15233/g.20014  ORF Transcript_15233/g.20014 Transcript_15233/m.20014 type:complete len:328 (+) Transcript_15233:2-985(+)